LLNVSIPCLHSKAIKKCITITANIAKAELFDTLPSQIEDFWPKLLCHGGSLVDHVIVNVDNKCSSIDRPSEYRWYPHTLIKTLLLVSAI